MAMTREGVPGSAREGEKVIVPEQKAKDRVPESKQIVATSIASKIFFTLTSPVRWAWNNLVPAVISGNAHTAIPKISGNPFWGRVGYFTEKYFTSEMARLAETADADDSKKCYFWLGHKPAVFLTNPIDIRCVFLQHQDCLEREGSLIPFSHVYNTQGDNIFVVSSHDKAKGAAIWKAKREVTENAIFKSEALRQLVGPMKAVIDKQLAKLDEKVIDPSKEFTILAMTMIDELLLLKESDSESTEKLSKVYDDVFRGITDVKSAVYVKLQAAAKQLNINFEIELDRLRKQLEDAVRIHLLAKNINRQGREEKGHQNLLDKLLQSVGKDVTDENLIEEGKFILLAGHETTSRLLQFTLMELARNPEVLKKLRQEIDSLEVKDQEGTQDEKAEQEEKPKFDLSKYVYLDKVLKESLRLNPPVPVIAREVVKPFKLNDEKDPSKSIFIKAGGFVLFSPYYTHRFAPVFKNNNPNVFNPDRFKTGDPDPEGYNPFGIAERRCPGQRFSLQEAKLALIKLVREYDFTMDDNIKKPFRVDMLGTLRCVDQVRMKFTKRDFTKAPVPTLK